MGYLDKLDNPKQRELQMTDAMPPPFDLPFPTGFRGLPRAQVEMALTVQDKLGITDQVLRKYNVLTWILDYMFYFAARDKGGGIPNENIKEEIDRLSRILAEDDPKEEAKE